MMTEFSFLGELSLPTQK